MTNVIILFQVFDQLVVLPEPPGTRLELPVNRSHLQPGLNIIKLNTNFTAASANLSMRFKDKWILISEVQFGTTTPGGNPAKQDILELVDTTTTTPSNLSTMTTTTLINTTMTSNKSVEDIADGADKDVVLKAEEQQETDSNTPPVNNLFTSYL